MNRANSKTPRKLLHFLSWTLAFALLPASISHASFGISDKNEVEIFVEEAFATLNESQDFLAAGIRDLGPVADYLNLMKWKDTPEDLALPKDPYNRKLHFGRWINDPNDDTCFNTRAKVLVRDSRVDVDFRETNKCVVERGQWHDPYSDKELTVARETQIDHMVPLKNAYVAGAWSWDFKLRCLYANYLNEDFHLVPVEAIQNQSKGDRGPDGYLPPNVKFTCQYLRNWLAVKLIWKLQMTKAEAVGIKQAFQEAGCRETEFRFAVTELREQRKYISQNLDLCESLAAKKDPKTP